MYLLRTVSGLTLGLCLALPVLSQSLAGLGGPAELPPGSFSGEQYVDSRGCVFIRAGYGGQETWVPRVSRDRQPLCGYQPTFGAGGGGTAVAEAPASRPTPIPQQQTGGDSLEVVIDMPQPTAPPAAPAPSDPRPTAATAAAAAMPQQRPAPQPARRVVTCQGLPAGAAQYMQGSGVRCGPQGNHPSAGGLIRPGAAMSAAGSRVAQLTPVVIPEGYRSAWDDGRLNAARGLANATPEGDAQIARYWTETVPREAVEVDPVADGVPVSYSASGQVVTRSSSTPDITAPAAAEASPETPRVQVPRGHRYVEIARYSERGNADAARAQLQRQGVATQLGAVAGGGGYGSYVVLAGPFSDPQSLARTLVRAQGLGYSGAVTR